MAHPASLGLHRRDWLRQMFQAGVATQCVLTADELLANDAPLVVEAYCDRVSCLPGEQVGLCVSTNAERYSVEVRRVGLDRRVVWRMTDLPGKLHSVPEDAATHGCGWPVSVKIPVGKDWTSGYYQIALQGESGDKRGDVVEAVLIVRARHPGQQKAILFQVSTNTYQAYNTFGATSLYSGPDFPRVSFDRPYLIYETPLPPGGNWYNPNTNNYHTWDEPFILWAEKAGYRIDYCANLDLEFQGELLDEYKLVLSVGHDEYWSEGMRDNLEAYIERGGNVAFFSGNSICWQIRVEEHGRALVCYKRAHDRDPVFETGDYRNLTTLWSDPLLQRPENHLSGVGFAYGGYNGLHGEFMSGPGAGEYTVHRPDHWILAGTGLRRGEKFGAEAGIAGYECDGCELVWKDGLPLATGRDGTPQDFEIVATAPCRWDKEEGSLAWAHGIRQALPEGELMPSDLTRDGNAVIGTYTRGGRVVTVGSCDWPDGLKAGDPHVDRIVRNVLNRLTS